MDYLSWKTTDYNVYGSSPLYSGASLVFFDLCKKFIITRNLAAVPMESSYITANAIDPGG